MCSTDKATRYVYYRYIEIGNGGALANTLIILSVTTEFGLYFGSASIHKAIPFGTTLKLCLEG